MSSFRIEVRPAAVRALRKLDPAVRPRIQGAIALLAQDPRPPAARALRGRPGYRVRVGEYRIIYTVADDVLLIVVALQLLDSGRVVFGPGTRVPRTSGQPAPAARQLGGTSYRP